MTADVELLPCGECGMPCRPGEYHPYAACLMFKTCRNSDTVRGNLQDAQDHATAAKDAEVEALRAEVEMLRDAFSDEDMTAGAHWFGRYVEQKRCTERLVEALREWWAAHRPVGWTEDQHLACPYVNLPTGADKAMAEALLREQEEGRG